MLNRKRYRNFRLGKYDTKSDISFVHSNFNETILDLTEINFHNDALGFH